MRENENSLPIPTSVQSIPIRFRKLSRGSTVLAGKSKDIKSIDRLSKIKLFRFFDRAMGYDQNN
jgi:hypothetical protein